ncbi:MAG: endopeptidase La [Anaeromusa sp.]|uniref:endopeptidase La n=1 Tax=Anaeromusa sp. TaxID=1872520 RepID=UPI002B21EEEE|nr:endopeptidase La [Anaeromusa sp.]MEA4834732.1 endopeptidase La [Anaeromusa sp.]
MNNAEIFNAKRTLPLLPLRGILVFPYMIIHLDVGREKSVKALEAAMLAERQIVLATQMDAQIDTPTPEEIYRCGTVAEIKQLLKLPGGTIRVLVEGLRRARIEAYLETEDFFQVEVSEAVEDVQATPAVEAYKRNMVEAFEKWAKLSKKIPPETLVSVLSINESGRLADLIASHLALKLEDKQMLLEALDVEERLEKLCDILARELEILELEKKISGQVRKQMEKTQKEYYLREQMKAIQKELGDKDERMAEVEEYRRRLAALELPKETADKIAKEIDRLEKMPSMTAETAVLRNYLDWVLVLPWKEETEDLLDITAAETILNEDHYGLEKVKERILEYLSVRQLTESMKGPILCLVGPPGVGKTSLARSVARSLGRKFVRISLGGVRDEAEIRGHRRTYVGALPGRIIQGMRTAGSKNPVFLLDEIDKMNADFRGDPSSALLEVLDPEQNNTFSDHYVELPFDLSKVLWMVTANVLHSIPRPLLDRMEVIHLAGYTEEEKLEIAKQYLLSKQLKENGLKPSKLNVPEKVLVRLIREYTREAGVRGLERTIATLCRKAARQIVQNRKKSIRVTEKNLETYMGIPRFRQSPAEKKNQIGVSTGLAWTEVGGDVLPVEVSVLNGKGALLLTGKLGEVMRESAQAGVSYIRSRVEELGIDEEFHAKKDLHIHLPEGAIPKDGPSAGITMATAVISALTGRAVRGDLAMTGEITLRGRVLPVGGVKEKVLAAHRLGIRTIILPKENRRDLEDIPADIRKELRFVEVEHMDEVLKEALVK